ncbi:zinc ribbon domain-containing protein [Nonomuraea sp. B19D2]|uniref:zinc ribbon domain-containing protein n=1 Tax=Nonomuraea sp. B19D2 TaxID=3159561 RepID=UPI0032DBF088
MGERRRRPGLTPGGRPRPADHAAGRRPPRDLPLHLNRGHAHGNDHLEATRRRRHPDGRRVSRATVITESDCLLSGLIRCQHCGKARIGAATHGWTERYRYHVGLSRQRFSKATCAADRIPADQAEGGILDALPASYEDSNLVIRAAEAAARANEGLSGKELPPGRPSPTGRRIDTAACRISHTVEAAIV